MRYIVRANDELEGWDIIDTHDWTSDVDDERENPVLMTVWAGSIVESVVSWLNSAERPGQARRSFYAEHDDGWSTPCCGVWMWGDITEGETICPHCSKTFLFGSGDD
jgi:hypothetical protein